MEDEIWSQAAYAIVKRSKTRHVQMFRELEK